MLFTRPVKLFRRLLRSSWPLPLVLKSLHESAHCFFPIWNPWTHCCTRNNLLTYRDHFSFTGRTENSHSPNFDHGVTLYDACNLLVKCGAPNYQSYFRKGIGFLGNLNILVVLADPCLFESTGQPDSQGHASSKLTSTFGQVLVWLVMGSWLALKFVEIKFVPKSMQVFHCLATQPKWTQVEWRQLTYH